MLLNMFTVLFFLVTSYPLSHYLMTRGMSLDMTMPSNEKRYLFLGVIFRIPVFNFVFMLLYLIVMVHKFKR